MKSVNVKNNIPTPDYTLNADDFNAGTQELMNLITGTGQALDAFNEYQTAIASAIYAVSGNFYVDTGSANNYLLAPIGLLKAPNVYTEGMHIRFLPLNTNTTSSNVNISGLGSVPIYKYSTVGFVSIVASDIVAGAYADIVYNSSLTQFILQNPQTNLSGFFTGMKIPFDGGISDVPPGWILSDNGTIGDAASGGTTLADASTQAYFIMLWNNTTDTNCPVSGGRGANALADFNAHKNIRIPQHDGCAIGVVGSGRPIAFNEGTYTVSLTDSQNGPHNHSPASPAYAFITNGSGTANTTEGSNIGSTATTNTSGSGSAHSNTQPTTYSNLIIKL